MIGQAVEVRQRAFPNVPFGIATGGNRQIIFDVQLIVELHYVSELAGRGIAGLLLTLHGWCVFWCVHTGLSIKLRQWHDATSDFRAGCAQSDVGQRVSTGPCACPTICQTDSDC